MLWFSIVLLFRAVSGDEPRNVNWNYYYPEELPEIVINKNANPTGYHYPNPPVLFDEIPPIELPLKPEIPPPETYLPPATSYGVPNFKNHQTSVFKLINMSCSDLTPERFFHARFSIDTVNFPVLENQSQTDCVVRRAGFYEINLFGATRLKGCGVGYCSDRNLCLRIYVPTVRGLKLPEDVTVQVQCRPQQLTLTQVKQFKIKPLNTQARSLGTTASGGAQRNLETQVAVYRKSPATGDFSQMITPGGTVLLGEELLLRASVREGDGWKFSRMGSVTVQPLTPRPDQELITLIDSSGCRPDTMKAICPEHPKQTNGLITTLPFRAFMFANGPGDEMILSVRLHACLQQEDCLQGRRCELKNRFKRGANWADSNASFSEATKDFESSLDFRVLQMEESRADRVHDGFGPGALTAVSVLFFATFAIIFIVCVTSRRFDR